MIQRQLLTINFSFTTLLMLLFFSLAVNAQQQTQAPDTQATNRMASASMAKAATSATVEHAPLYNNFRGVELGMPADEIREKLGNIKDKGKKQDFFVFSDSMTAQVFYDESGKAIAISVDYVGKENKAPSPEEVLGQSVQARSDGSIHELKRYPEAGYWIAYNRTAGDNPITTITMQKM